MSSEAAALTPVVLLRHARSTANADGILAGRMPGVRLDPEGERQAARLPERLQHIEFHAVVASPLVRCQQTARAAVGPDVFIVDDARLTECDYGDWSGRSLADLAHEPLWADVQRAPADVTFPGGESMTAMSDRAWAAVTEHAADAAGKPVLVCSHGDVIKAIVARSVGLPLNDFQRLRIAPCSVSVIWVGADSAALERFNDAGPLRLGPSGAAAATVGGQTA